MLAVFGLGNPGREYKGTRHNVGFEVVDRLAEELGVKVSRRRFKARIGEGQTDAGRLLLVKPRTYMNDSGRSVQAAVAWNKLALDQILIVCDDLDLEFAKVRARRKGSSGGHKGLESIARALGTAEFPRLRVGIGRPPGDAIEYVLDRFAGAERKKMTEAVGIAAQAVACWANEGIEACMNEFN